MRQESVCAGKQAPPPWASSSQRGWSVPPTPCKQPTTIVSLCVHCLYGLFLLKYPNTIEKLS